MGNSRFQYIEQDINFELKLPGGLAGIFHFASLASPVDYALRPIETLHVGAMGSDNALQLAREKSRSSLRRPPRFTATRWSTLKSSPTGATSIRSVLAAAMTSPSAIWKH